LSISLDGPVPFLDLEQSRSYDAMIVVHAPQYCRATPTEAVPCFGKLVPSRINTPVRSGMTSRNRCHTASASHGACVMKCWNA